TEAQRGIRANRVIVTVVFISFIAVLHSIYRQLSAAFGSSRRRRLASGVWRLASGVIPSFLAFTRLPCHPIILPPVRLTTRCAYLYPRLFTGRADSLANYLYAP